MKIIQVHANGSADEPLECEEFKVGNMKKLIVYGLFASNSHRGETHIFVVPKDGEICRVMRCQFVGLQGVGGSRSTSFASTFIVESECVVTQAELFNQLRTLRIKEPES